MIESWGGLSAAPVGSALPLLTRPGALFSWLGFFPPFPGGVAYNHEVFDDVQPLNHILYPPFLDFIIPYLFTVVNI